MKILFFLAALSLAACGADGPPETPGVRTGISVSGTAEIGVSGTK